MNKQIRSMAHPWRQCRRRWLQTALAVSAIATLAVSAAEASAATTYDEQLPLTSVHPMNGDVFRSDYGEIQFELQTPLTGAHLTIEIATQDIAGQDGTLADDYVVGRVFPAESDAFPGIYRGSSGYIPNGAWWSSRPGAYYWQVQAWCYSGESPACGEGFHYLKSGAYSIVIQQPPTGADAPQGVPPGSGATPCSRASIAKKRALQHIKVARRVLRRRALRLRDARNRRAKRQRRARVRQARRLLRKRKADLRKAGRRRRAACS